MHQAITFHDPVKNFLEHINPFFGYFGERIHPERKSPYAFHSGVDIAGKNKTSVYAMLPGILEYSGYGLVNGKYIMLSHPHIITQDGYVLHTLYIHLSHMRFAFSAYQKMLREISLHTYPRISVPAGAELGGMGKTGASSYPEEYTHVHIQCELRNKEGHIVFLDPLRILTGKEYRNLTADTQHPEDFQDIYHTHRDRIHEHKLEAIWDMPAS
ncbi:MAG: M23 family metallopeptidase [Candidatus Pacebacteria bacterium]|nr:M23 family metallopeptidase [Candidatus Paceibacterota bacterium]